MPQRRHLVGGVHDHPVPRRQEPPAQERRPGVRRARPPELRAAVATLKSLRAYPITLTFLLAYLFYNDGIQTVIYAASVYGEKELDFEKSTVLSAFLIVQFVGIGGALLFGRIAAATTDARHHPGRADDLDRGRGRWATSRPRRTSASFVVLAASIGLVLGGTQALSRSYFSQLIPRGREAEYFSLYQACERGTAGSAP